VALISFREDPGVPITQFASRAAASVDLAHGDGDAHVYVVHVDAGGEIGPHEAGFGQLFVVVTGSGWVREADGPRVEVDAGQAAFFPRGTVHSKGSDEGMTAVMIQVTDLYRDLP
jgi:quercetin dioxygenase-like cupin family protein